MRALLELLNSKLPDEIVLLILLDCVDTCRVCKKSKLATRRKRSYCSTICYRAV